jgi:hypothetical protein
MIKITHSCWNTRHRKTVIGRDDSFFRAVGVPLQVLLHSFLGKNIIWFTKTFGEWDDNTLLVGLDPDNTEHLEKKVHKTTSPIGEAWQHISNFTEYDLSPVVLKALGISLDWGNKDEFVAQASRVEHFIYIHDDCFSCVKLSFSNLFQSLVENVLQQHSFYLDAEIDWSRVSNHIYKIAESSKSLVLQSNPKRCCLKITTQGFWQEIRSIFLPSLSCAVLIENGVAVWFNNHSIGKSY